MQSAVDAFGRLDVLVNNAGYGLISPFEQIAPADFQAVMDTCFYGVVYATRAALPVMRKQRSGWILQISSVGGRITVPGNTPYHAAKWAVGGFSESLAAEVAPFGVKVCMLEPGGIRTNWAKRARQDAPELLSDYEASVGTMLKLLRNLVGSEESDPKKIAHAILELTAGESAPKRLILGVDAANRLQQWEEARRDEAAQWRSLTESTVSDEPVVFPQLEFS